MRSTSPDNHVAVQFGVLGRLLAMLPIYEFLLIVAGFLLIVGTAYGWIWYVGPSSSIPAGVRFRNHEMLDKDGNTLARWNKGSWVNVEPPRRGVPISDNLPIEQQATYRGISPSCRIRGHFRNADKVI